MMTIEQAKEFLSLNHPCKWNGERAELGDDPNTFYVSGGVALSLHELVCVANVFYSINNNDGRVITFSDLEITSWVFNSSCSCHPEMESYMAITIATKDDENGN